MKNILLSAIFLFSTASHAQTWVPVGSAGFSDTTAYNTSLAIDGSGTPYVAFVDIGDSGKVSVMKYNGSSWVYAGGPGISAGSAQWTDIAIDNSGTPYVVYEDGANSGRTSVLKYNGSSWVTVGIAGFSANGAENTTIAIDTGGTAYVAYRDLGNDYKATVMKYNGSSWVSVGSAGFSPYAAYYPSIAIDGSGAPYVVYQGDTDGFTPAFYGPATVMKFNGTGWATVGNPGFTAGTATYISIAIDNSGTPYVIYQDDANNEKATVMKCSGGIWVNVGSPGFSQGSVFSTSIAIDNSGTPYVSYIDDTMPNVLGPIAVRKFNGSSWESVGGNYCSDSLAVFTSIALDGSGTPYVAFGEIANYVAGTVKATVVKLNTSTTAIKTITAPTNSLIVFPNPSSGSFTLNISSAMSENANVIISNMLGEKVKEFTAPVNSDVPLQMGDVPGVYYIDAIFGNGSVAKKVIIQ